MVKVTADSRVTADQLAKLKQAMAPFGDAAKLSRIPGEMRPLGPVNGGKYIEPDDGPQNACSAGFNVRKKVRLLTAAIAGKPPSAVILPTELVVRESG